MACYKCGADAVGTCCRCGAGFCWTHGGRRKGDRDAHCGLCRPVWSSSDRRFVFILVGCIALASLFGLAYQLVQLLLDALGR